MFLDKKTEKRRRKVSDQKKRREREINMYEALEDID